MGIHWQPAGSNPARPVARPGENSHQTLSPICRFCDECRWNYILKEDEVPGSNPGGFNKWGHSSTVERVKYVSSILSSQFFATNAGVTTCNPKVAGSNPASGPMNDRSSSVGRAAENVSPNLVVASLGMVVWEGNDFGANAVGTTSVASSSLAGSNRRGRSLVVERLFRQKLVAPVFELKLS